jgi:hypothetical protein
MGPLLSIEEGFDVPRDVLQLVNQISTSTNEPFVNLFNQPVSIRAAADASCIQLKGLSRMKILQPLQIIQLEDAQKLPWLFRLPGTLAVTFIWKAGCLFLHQSSRLT